MKSMRIRWYNMNIFIEERRRHFTKHKEMEVYVWKIQRKIGKHMKTK